MANAFKHIRTVPTECGGKSWLYSTGNDTAEIDTTAKTKKTLLNRLDTLFCC